MDGSCVIIERYMLFGSNRRAWASLVVLDIVHYLRSVSATRFRGSLTQGEAATKAGAHAPTWVVIAPNRCVATDAMPF